jgi:hypothetical protein
VGGAIVADSDPARELQETRDKALAFTRAIALLHDAGGARPSPPAPLPAPALAPGT